MFRFNLRQRPALSVSSCAGAKLTRETLVLSLDFGYVLKKNAQNRCFAVAYSSSEFMLPGATGDFLQLLSQKI